MSDIFSEAGIDPIKGAELFRLLDVYPHDFLDPLKVSKIKEVTKFFSNKEGASYLVKKITKFKDNKLDRFWEYVQLRTEIDAKKNTAKIFINNNVDPDVVTQFKELTDDISTLEQEIELYEKDV